MLQEVNGAIVEKSMMVTTTTTGSYAPLTGSTVYPTGTTYYPTVWVEPVYYWNSYPVYVCTDKTKKAIEILKALQADKQLECKSVTKFIELVEKIAGLL